MSASDEGFLARWSRRKSGRAPDAAEPQRIDSTEEPGPPAAAPVALADSRATAPGATPAAHATHVTHATPVAPATAPVPAPTMDDVAALTRGSDYSRFVGSDVDRDVSNAAMKKLFSDPHFNVMDGLDTYIDDYGKPDPIPPSMLRIMNQAVTLGLFDDEDRASEEPASGGGSAQACPDGEGFAAVAQSTASPSSVPQPAPPLPADDDADLRLQPDDAPGCRGPEPGPRA